MRNITREQIAEAYLNEARWYFDLSLQQMREDWQEKFESNSWKHLMSWAMYADSEDSEPV